MLTTECPIEGMLWVTLPDHIAGRTLGAFNVMLQLRKAFPQLIINTIGQRHLWIMRRWPS